MKPERNQVAVMAARHHGHDMMTGAVQSPSLLCPTIFAAEENLLSLPFFHVRPLLFQVS